MHSMMRRTQMAALCAAALVAACSKGDKTPDSASVNDTTHAAGAAGGGAATATNTTPSAAPMTDANIAAFLDNANVADSSDGSLASSKGTSADVRTFGKDMMRDHHALRKAGQDVAKKANITPAPAAGDTSAAAAKTWHDSLNAMPKGAAFDKAYIDHEVAVHQFVLQTAQNAAGSAQNADLKALIQKAAPNIQSHLDHAKQIQSKLGTK